MPNTSPGKPADLPQRFPAPPTAAGPEPPESPSSTVYLPRLPVFPRPSPILIYRGDLQSALSIPNTSSIVGAVLHLARIEAEASIQSRPYRRNIRTLAQAHPSPFRVAFAAAATVSILRCCNNY